MRVSIEIGERQRAELLRIAAARGEQDLSAVIRAAVDYFLAHHTGCEDAVRAVIDQRSREDRAWVYGEDTPLGRCELRYPTLGLAPFI